MSDARERAAAEILRRTPAARRGLVRRLLAAPFERARLVSLPTDHLILRAPRARPARRRLLVKLTVQGWAASACTALRWKARQVVARLTGVPPVRP